jgi:hypothetical protein
MTEDEANKYTIDRLPAVSGQIRDLASRAAAKGQQREFLEILKSIVKELTNKPLAWGDPEYRTRKKGGFVCHGTRPPLFVQFAVFEEERKVMILKIRALPGSYLE